jgi:hypothetical protein
MFKRLITTAAVFGTAALAPPTFAQNAAPLSCMPRDALVQDLMRSYGEDLLGRGLQNPQQLLEIWSSGDSGSFTIFITHPDGQSCVVATGGSWIGYEPPNTDLES